VKNVEYLDGFQYVGGELNFFQHAEGYVNVTLGTTGNRIFNYVYYYTDHLGNIRLTYTKDMVSNELKIMDENHYYPFGLKHQKYSPAGSLDLKAQSAEIARPGYATTTPFMYKYNGMELQDELGLNLYDYGWRQYDPAIARWVVPDPLAEQYRRWSPYNYAVNNPLRYIDPDGMGVDDVIITGKYKDEAFNQLQKGTNLDLKMDEKGKLSATGEAKTDADKVLAAAINNENVVVNVNTTSSNYNDKGQWMIGGSYEGSKIIAGGKDDGKVVADQTVNPSMTKEMDSFNEMGEGTTILHEVMEAYVGAVTAPGAIGLTASDGNPLGYQQAHDAAKGLDPRYIEATISHDCATCPKYMNKPHPIIPGKYVEKMINNMKK